MSYQAHPQEVAAVSALSAEERYSYAVRKIADWGEVWSIADSLGQWCQMADDTGQRMFPIWPAQAFAQQICTGAWAEDRPQAIPLDQFLEKWVPGLLNDGLQIAVFPDLQQHGAAVSPETLRSDLEEQLDQLL